MPSESRFQELINTILNLQDEGRSMLKKYNNTKDTDETSEILAS